MSTYLGTSQYLSNTIKSFHEQTLRLVCNDCEHPFKRALEELKKKKKKYSRKKNFFESLATEIFKLLAILTTPIGPQLWKDMRKHYEN